MKYICLLTALLSLIFFSAQGEEYSSRAGLVEITQTHFDEAVLKSNKPVVVLVSATWCRPCQQLKPVANEVAKTLGDSHLFVKMDFDQNREISNKYPVQGLPTILFFKDGQLKGSASGFMSQQQLKAKIHSMF